ncbi:TetR/AcrR family transcriptional regulator [Maritimibacter dapengensis]|uniref:TetR family transcriptional regulator n=1 Tax=Maritimibacter dapengensis TaxID=2836868 RepID=A0ABS6T7F9_9RHOB|nr:TetR/AcrR family transcriptional regulator [Maritimibacter dapengensis]MBV7380426.1 TetR family transcriptional regulator [Maritimibacter dapengensis]
MQVDKKAASNAARREQTRKRLIAAARARFVSEGFAGTATPDLVRDAGVTRGALYHHFEDKTDLFRAVVTAEAQAVADEIESVSERAETPREALLSGARAYFDAMSREGRVQLLLRDGPAQLGDREMAEIDRSTSAASLRDGLFDLMASEEPGEEVEAIADILAAGFDRAALAIANGASPDVYLRAITRLLDLAAR